MHSLQKRWPSLQATGSRARCKQRAQASKRRMDSFPSRCYAHGIADAVSFESQTARRARAEGDSAGVWRGCSRVLCHSRVSCILRRRRWRTRCCSCCVSSWLGGALGQDWYWCSVAGGERLGEDGGATWGDAGPVYDVCGKDDGVHGGTGRTSPHPSLPPCPLQKAASGPLISSLAPPPLKCRSRLVVAPTLAQPSPAHVLPAPTTRS